MPRRRYANLRAEVANLEAVLDAATRAREGEEKKKEKRRKKIVISSFFFFFFLVFFALCFFFQRQRPRQRKARPRRSRA